MPFQNEITGVDGTLERPQIQSVDYVPGVSGWAIFRNGTAEFNSTTIRGSLTVTDPDGSNVHIFDENPGQGAVVDIRPADTPAGTLTAARIIGQLNGSNRPYLQIQSAQLNGAGFSQIQLYADELGNKIITLIGGLTQVQSDLDVSGDANFHNAEIDIGSGGLVVYTVPSPSGNRFIGQGRGIIGTMYYTGGTGATSAGATEVALPAWTASNDLRFVNGRKYSAEIGGGAFTSTASPSPGEVAAIRLRSAVGSTAAQVLGTVQVPTPAGASVQSFTRRIYFKNTSGADIDKTSLGLTVARAAGAGNSSLFGNAAPGPTGPLYCIVRDEGFIGETQLDNMMVAIT